MVERVTGAGEPDVMQDGGQSAEFAFQVATKVAVGMSSKYRSTQPRRVWRGLGAEHRNRCGAGDRAGRMMAESEAHGDSSANSRRS